MVSVTFTIHHDEFDRTLEEYFNHTKRTVAEALNEKAFFISRGAALYTHKASEGGIRTLFGQSVVLNKKKRGVGFRKTRNLSLFSAQADTINAPLLAAIINKRRGKRGLPGLTGRAMLIEMNRVFNARIRSIAFIKSGWIPAIKHFEKFSKYKRNAPPMDNAAKIVGAGKGGAVEATENAPIASLWNDVGIGKRNKGRLEAVKRYGEEGLRKAFDAEVASMNEYIERKMNPDAERFNNAQK